MSARFKTTVVLAISIGLYTAASVALSAAFTPIAPTTLAEQLGWTPSNENICGGYYLESAFQSPENTSSDSAVQITGGQGVFSQQNTTVLEGQVSIVRSGQQMTANKAFLYRDPNTKKLNSMDLVGNVHLREPNTLVIARQGHYDFVSRNKALQEILYRTTLATSTKPVAAVSKSAYQQDRKINSMTAWGEADKFAQNEPKVYELWRSTFSTCPPTSPAWHVKASHLVINKNIGRGYATNARIYVKNVPVLYIPYFNFSIDHRRKSGFLWPSYGNKGDSSNTFTEWGPFIIAPFYWNMAENHDMTFTAGWLSKRGVKLTDKFRYLSEIGYGDINIGLLPNDSVFETFQTYAQNTYGNSTNNVTQAELTRLLTNGTTRKSFTWHDDSQYNQHWSSKVDFNYAGDDYYLRDFGDLNETTQNQIPQSGELYYKGENWNFTGRLQTYQTMHPINEQEVQNQYRRFPQLLLAGDYPDQAFGLDYFVQTEATHFDIRNTPGTLANQPVGNRFHLQPGVSLPLFWPYFYINPRIQLSMTGYNLTQTFETQTPNSAKRTIPIFDMAIGAAFNRSTKLFDHYFQQTLEPQVYYTYIPYRNQASIPKFDTTVNTLTYDQIFNYNRFSSIDRIGDANQLGVGVTSRFLDGETGMEKIRIGIGNIIYFSNRRVTFCNNVSCSDNPFNPANHWRLSPISGLLLYNVNPAWSFQANALANPISKQLSNASLGLHYKPDERHIMNLGYGYVFDNDPLSGAGSITNTSANNLKLSDFSFVWPASSQVSVIGRWSQNWNQQHLQNLIYGLQYDTCCWAVQMVGGRTFVTLDPTQNNSPKYSDQIFIQFALKGLGNIGSGNPSGLLNTIGGYSSTFGQEI